MASAPTSRAGRTMSEKPKRSLRWKVTNQTYPPPEGAHGYRKCVARRDRQAEAPSVGRRASTDPAGAEQEQERQRRHEGDAHGRNTFSNATMDAVAEAWPQTRPGLVAGLPAPTFSRIWAAAPRASPGTCGGRPCSPRSTPSQTVRTSVPRPATSISARTAGVTTRGSGACNRHTRPYRSPSSACSSKPPSYMRSTISFSSCRHSK